MITEYGLRIRDQLRDLAQKVGRQAGFYKGAKMPCFAYFRRGRTTNPAMPYHKARITRSPHQGIVNTKAPLGSCFCHLSGHDGPKDEPKPPIEKRDQQGGNAFMDIAVPDAAMRLVQACGRLLRTEEDSGTITILDKRLLTKRYGKLLLKSLPSFTLAFPES